MRNAHLTQGPFSSRSQIDMRQFSRLVSRDATLFPFSGDDLVPDFFHRNRIDAAPGGVSREAIRRRGDGRSLSGGRYGRTPAQSRSLSADAGQWTEAAAADFR